MASRGLYVPNRGGGANTVSVLNTITDAEIGGTPIAGFHAPFACAVLPNDLFVYVSNNTNATASVISTTTETITGGPIALPNSGPQILAASPDGHRVYVPNGGSGQIVTAIDVPANTTHSVTTGFLPQSCAVAPNSLHAYSVNGDGNQTGFWNVSVIDTVALTAVQFSSGSAFTETPLDCALTPDGSKLWITTTNANKVYIFDTTAHTFTSIALGAGNSPQGVTIRPDGLFAYVACATSGVVKIIDTTTHTITTMTLLGAGGGATGIIILPDQSKGYVSCITANNLITFNPNTNTALTNLSGGSYGFSSPFFMGVTPTVFIPPGTQFIPKLFIPIKGKIGQSYTADELNIDWLAIERWSQRWLPPPTIALFFPHKTTSDINSLNANWLELEMWANQIRNSGATYSPIFIPRKSSDRPDDLDVNWLSIQNWANRLPL